MQHIAFNIAEYVNDMVVNKEDEELQAVKDLLELKHHIYQDAWTVRQSCYNEAFGMKSHLEYLGSTLLPNAERRINQLEGSSVVSMDFNTDWATKGTVNEDQPREDEDIPRDQQVDDQKTFVDQLKGRMRTCAMSFVMHVQEHDEISKDLNQLSFTGIQARAEQNRKQKQKVG